jgi:uncharacterized membrane protein (DUF106 family)
MFDGFFNLIFGWAIALGSPWNILIMSFILTFLITIIYKFTTDQILLKELKSQAKHYQQQMKNHKSDPQKMMEFQKQAMSLNMKHMKHSMKPMLYTFIPIILVWGWLKATPAISAKDIITWGFSIPLFGTGLGWLGTYMFSSIIFSMILRKIMRVH